MRWTVRARRGHVSSPKAVIGFINAHAIWSRVVEMHFADTQCSGQRRPGFFGGAVLCRAERVGLDSNVHIHATPRSQQRNHPTCLGIVSPIQWKSVVVIDTILNRYLRMADNTSSHVAADLHPSSYPSAWRTIVNSTSFEKGKRHHGRTVVGKPWMPLLAMIRRPASRQVTSSCTQPLVIDILRQESFPYRSQCRNT